MQERRPSRFNASHDVPFGRHVEIKGWSSGRPLSTPGVQRAELQATRAPRWLTRALANCHLRFNSVFAFVKTAY